MGKIEADIASARIMDVMMLFRALYSSLGVCLGGTWIFRRKELVWLSSIVPYRRLVVGQKKKKQVCYSSYFNYLFKYFAYMYLSGYSTNNSNSWISFEDSPGRLCMSVRDYYCYKFQMRPGIFNPILYGKRLFQQFAVDTYIKIESSRLDYIRNHQDDIRADLYQGLVDSLHAGEGRAEALGKRTVMPSSFIGGPRDMRRRYMDAMALVRRFGKPDIFLTMTCNPKWDEIQRELYPGQTPQDRPDLVVRVFRAKLQELKNRLLKMDILGKVLAHVYVVEF
jgi:hypothetical protein